MKSQRIVASFIAGFGVYLTLTTLITAIVGVVGALGAAHAVPEAWIMVAVQYAGFAVPFALGCVLVFWAYRIAAVVSRAARISDEQVSLPDPMALLRVSLACIGVFVLINAGSIILQLAYNVLVAKGATKAIGDLALRQIPEAPELVALLMQVVAAVVLIKKAAAIARWFERRWDRAA